MKNARDGDTQSRLFAIEDGTQASTGLFIKNSDAAVSECSRHCPRRYRPHRIFRRQQEAAEPSRRCCRQRGMSVIQATIFVTIGNVARLPPNECPIIRCPPDGRRTKREQQSAGTDDSRHEAPDTTIIRRAPYKTTTDASRLFAAIRPRYEGSMSPPRQTSPPVY